MNICILKKTDIYWHYNDNSNNSNDDGGADDDDNGNKLLATSQKQKCRNKFICSHISDL